MFCGPEGRIVGSLQRRVQSHMVSWEIKNCTPLWCEAGFETPRSRTTFGSWDVEKVHAAVACGAEHMWKWKGTKHLSFGALLEVGMFKKCTPLWREAHFQVNSVKHCQSQTTFGSWEVEKVHAPVARSTFPSETCTRQTTFGSRKSEHSCARSVLWRQKCLKEGEGDRQIDRKKDS